MQIFDKSHPCNESGRPLMATVGVENILDAQAAYVEALGYEVVCDKPVSQEYARLWGDEKIAGCSSRVLRPQSETPVCIRLIETDVSDDATPGPGWFALELCVRDSAVLYEQLCSSDYFQPFAPPTELSFTDKIFPFQCRGSNGEILYLNETRGNLPDIDLPIASSFVDHIFIVILSASDLEKSTDFYEAALAARLQESHEIPYKTINRVFDLPLSTLHKLNTLGTGRNVFLELDQLPGIAAVQQSVAGVHKGINCVTFNALPNHLLRSDFHSCSDAPYHGANVAQLRGPDGERIEVIDFEK